MRLPRGLYAIADAAFGDPYTLGVGLAQAGCPVIQLRAKDWAQSDVASVARRLIEPLHQVGSQLIINDHTMVAVEVGADGVHLGQDDGSIAEARALLGPNALIGLSTHSIDQVQRANTANYIGFGPVFETTTKAAAGSARGIDALKEVVERSSLPVVAIGGINGENLASVRATGVHGWAIVRDLIGAGPIEDSVHRLSIQPEN